MRNLAVSIVLAVACLLAEATGTRLAADADQDPDAIAVGILSADASCPAATHSTRSCPDLPTEAYLVFDKQKGKSNNLEGLYVEAFGRLDSDACWPKPLIHVTRIQRASAIPFCTQAHVGSSPTSAPGLSRHRPPRSVKKLVVNKPFTR